MQKQFLILTEFMIQKIYLLVVFSYEINIKKIFSS